MNKYIKAFGGHALAVLIFLIIVIFYFSPAILDGKVLKQGDSIKFEGMVKELHNYHETDHTYSEWVGSMFSGMPSYQVGIPGIPENPVNNIVKPVKKIDFMGGSIVLAGLIAFYILMCVMGVNRWLAIAGAIAYALASYNVIIIEAGHISKAYAIAYMPLTVAGMFLLFRNRYLWGFVLFVTGTALSIMEGHLQVTYYLAFFCLFIYLGYLCNQLILKKYRALIVVTLLLAAGSVLSIMPNMANLYSNYEMSKTSIRGASELTISGQNTETADHKVSSGLEKEYAFQWSYGVKELLTFLVPNAYGGSSGGALGPSSELYKEMRKNGAQTGKEVRTYTYWGDKAFTSGPVYFGALICFLFVLGMFVIRNPMKWWMLGAAIFFTCLSLGRNFDLFNDFMFHYLPMYNKFRTPEMALVIPGFIFPIIGFWGLKIIFNQEVSEQQLKKSFWWALGITGIPCILLWLMPTSFLSFQSAYDAQFQNSVPEWYYTALLMDRKELASADAFRSLLFIVSGAVCLAGFWFAKDKKKASLIVSVILIALVLGDLWNVDRRYLSEDNYTREKLQESFKASVADNEILKDTSPSYRVFNVNNPWQETYTSYFHKSIGGYHAAKLRRYQELIDNKLDPEYRRFLMSLQQAKTGEDLLGPLQQSTGLNMLNTRYIIYNPEYPPLYNPYAYGNAWFVHNIKWVDSANDEMDAMQTINPLTTAIIDKRFFDQLNGFIPVSDSTAVITLESYKPNALVYKSKANTDQAAVFSEVYYQPGWQAYLDGHEVPHFRADWILRGMIIPAGEHTIEFKFYPKGYRTATAISFYGGLLIVILFLAAIVYSLWKAFRKKENI